MKKLFLAFVMAVISLSVSAQCYIGGSFGLDRNTDENTTNFTISPEVGYNLNSKWAVGGVLGYVHNYNQGLSVNAFAINPYARFTYFRSANNLVNLFVDGGFDVAFGKARYDGESLDETIIPFNIGFKPGVAFNLTEKFTLVAHFGFLGYSGGNDDAKDAGYTEHFGFDFSSMNLNIGFYINF
ncbi:MAG: porin family protein [Muribaculaceae bacterium]|nr:porin family protein [Muribaculaceae bacterium]